MVRPASGSMPLVTVGMPVYNGDRYLKEAIDSILAQDLGDSGSLELVISDNGSTDGTEEICRAVVAADDRVRYVREPVNRGAAWNYNQVLELARGTYFHWAACDDRFAPSYLARCVHALQADPAVVLAYATTSVIDGDGRTIKTWRPRPGYARQARAADRFRDVLWHSVMCFEVFGVTRRSQLLETSGIGAFPGSDRPLLAELALRGRFQHIDEPLFVNRVHQRDSMHLYPGAKERARWFDPSSTMKFPHWRLLRAFTSAAWSGPARGRDRVAAVAVLPAWMSRERGSLAYDIVSALPGPLPAWAARVREDRRRARRRRQLTAS
ncbi:MAG TPA: glycosyltransferase family 2 protein [Nocardioidaceae bacterium]|nr:glycosyltransferase family 2 protein [Nocardioidaceae bacterium]